ncbi:MAG: TonB-dependent receptor [Pseudomonadota bacterium]
MKNKQKKFHFPKKIISLVIGGLYLSLSAQTTVAQIGSSSLHGVVALQEQPQAGLEVVAKNIDNGFTFRAVTQADGTYTFNGLRPGNYQIYLQEKSGKNPEPIQLKVGQSLNLDFQLDKATNENNVEEVVVVGSQLEATSVGGEIGTTVSLEQMNKLPQNTRNFLAFADLAPGVQFTQGTDGTTRIKGGAQSANAINVFIDGVGQKNYVLGGGITGQDSSRGNPFPQSAIGQYKIITQNYSAEYDQLSSAAIVAVTASGTNEFHGNVFYDYTDDGMREMRPSEIASNTKVPSKQGQYGISVGGPIIQDKMHFFFAYEAKNTSDPKDVVAGGNVKKEDFPAQFQSQLGGISADFEEDLYFGKLDYLISDEQKIELTAKVRKEVELTSVGNGPNTLSFGTDKKNDETRIDLSHNWRTDSWINDVHLSHEDAAFNPRPHTMGNGIRLTKGDNVAVLNTGGGPDFQNKGQKGWAIQNDFSYLAISNHIIKTGLKFKSVELHAKEQQPYNAQYYYNIENPADKSLYLWDTTPYKVSWGAPLSGIGDGSVTADAKQFGIYIQDDWTANDRLTVNVGVRWDYEESDSFLEYKTPEDVLAGLATSTNIQNSDVNINEYVSTGNNRKAFKDAWQPRLGFTYDLGDDNDAVLFGGVGRAYDRNLFDHLQLEVTKATFPTYDKRFIDSGGCAALSPTCLTWDEQYLTPEGLAQLPGEDRSAGREVFMVNNNLKTPYSDQFSFGVRGSLYEEWKAEVSFSHIESKDGFAWLLANRRDDGNFFVPGTTWEAPWGLGITGFGNTIIGTNGIETKADSLYIKLDKPKEDTIWGATIAYTYTQAKTNRKAGEVFSYDYPNIAAYGMHDANDVPEHRLVISSMLDLPYGIDFAAKLNLQSVETFYGLDCRAGGKHCVIRTFKPDSGGFLGYKQLDVSLSKTFATGTWVNGSDLTLRFDILNLTNAINHDGYQDWFGGAGEQLNPNLGMPTDVLAGPPLTMKLGVSWSW